jgi:hypothetical protein
VKGTGDAVNYWAGYHCGWERKPHVRGAFFLQQREEGNKTLRSKLCCRVWEDAELYEQMQSALVESVIQAKTINCFSKFQALRAPNNEHCRLL